MKSHIAKSFRERFAKLPPKLQKQARVTYRLWRENPQHPSLHFKPVRGNPSYYSVRVGKQYRALAIKYKGYYLWLWIGTHNEYDTLLNQLR